MVRKYVVTGAASGMGRATAELLRKSGFDVIGVDIRDAEIIADLATPDGRRKMVEEVEAKTGGVLNGLAACAGISRYEAVTMSVNFFGAIATLQGLRPFLAKAENPRAVAIASFGVLMPCNQDLIDAALAGDEAKALELGKDAGLANYTSSKSALAKWCRQAAPLPEWAGSGILLNLVAPGMVNTPMIAHWLHDPIAFPKYEKNLPLPLGRYAEPEEIAKLLQFLLSPDNSYVTGQMIFADGGAEALARGATHF